jgi:hypothetical protein
VAVAVARGSIVDVAGSSVIAALAEVAVHAAGRVAAGAAVDDNCGVPVSCGTPSAHPTAAASNTKMTKLWTLGMTVPKKDIRDEYLILPWMFG